MTSKKSHSSFAIFFTVTVLISTMAVFAGFKALAHGTMRLPPTGASQAADTKTSTPETGDRYGGAPVHVQKGTGYFTVAKIGNRWTLVTPDGNAFWMRAVYHAVEAFLEPGVIQSKYGGNVETWATQRNRRLLSWGFNSLGEYVSTRGLPVGTYGKTDGNPVQLPFVLLLNPLLTGMNDPTRLGMKDPLKNLLAGVPRSAWKGYRGRFPDIFDPSLPQYYAGSVAFWNRAFTGGFGNQSWVLGVDPDDADLLYLFKGNGESGVNKYPHPVYLISVAKFWYTSSEDAKGRDFSDHKFYSKYAWADFLKKKYGSIAALNKAWGSNYSSFDDDGGYGGGKGLLDEDGRHTDWMGSDPLMLSNAKPAVRSDMDTFLYQLAHQYATIAVQSIRATDKNHLIIAPHALNNHGFPAREQVLKGLSDGGFDVFCLQYNPSSPDLSGDNFAYEVTGKPAVVWYGVTANVDSGFHAEKAAVASREFTTQNQRGSAYARDVQALYDGRAKNGDAYFLGIGFWELIDNRSEKTNWGLISRKDNAYDGKEAIRAAGKDPWGFTTGGEDQDYGDFISSVRQTNFAIQQELTRDIGKAVGNSPANQKPAKGRK